MNVVYSSFHQQCIINHYIKRVFTPQISTFCRVYDLILKEETVPVFCSCLCLTAAVLQLQPAPAAAALQTFWLKTDCGGAARLGKPHPAHGTTRLSQNGPFNPDNLVRADPLCGE